MAGQIPAAHNNDKLAVQSTLDAGRGWGQKGQNDDGQRLRVFAGHSLSGNSVVYRKYKQGSLGTTSQGGLPKVRVQEYNHAWELSMPRISKPIQDPLLASYPEAAGSRYLIIQEP